MLFGGGSFIRDFWPEYAGYVGWRSSGVWDEISRHWHLYWRELSRTVELYFFKKRLFRIGEAPIDLRWGAESGGLSFGVVSVLGGVGGAVSLLAFISCLGRRERGELGNALSRIGVPLLLVGSGVLITMTSITTARRLLLLDAGWCLLAALGAQWVLDRCRGGRNVSGALFLLLPLWSYGVIQYLHHRSSELLIGGVARVNDIPFGQGWIGDGITCYRCQDVAQEWRETFAKNGAVVFFDTDRAREDPASPAGLFLMGKLAALSANKPEHLLRFYPIMENSSGMPLFQPYYGEGESFSRYLREKLTALAPSSLLLYSERPTQWEVAFFQRLSSFGVLKRFQTPLSEAEGVSLLLPAERLEEFLAVLSALEAAAPTTSRIALEEIEAERLALSEVPWGVALRGEKVAAATSFSVKTRTRDFPELAPITSLNFLPDGQLTLQQQYGGRYRIDASLEAAILIDGVNLKHAGFSCFADAGSGGAVPRGEVPGLPSDARGLPRAPRANGAGRLRGGAAGLLRQRGLAQPREAMPGSRAPAHRWF
jgi:hypothetical protein